jgi:hypothetical protein
VCDRERERQIGGERVLNMRSMRSFELLKGGERERERERAEYEKYEKPRASKTL